MQGLKYKSKILKWREKCKAYSQDKRRLQDKNRWLLKSRDNWKSKYKEEQSKKKELEQELIKLKEAQSLSLRVKTKVKHHHYTCEQISLCVHLRNNANSSLRSCVQIIEVLSFILGLSLFKPSINSIRNWEMKLGYHQLQKEDESEDEWALILDESLLIGQQKLLLLMGVNLTKYDFTSPLNFKDSEVLGLRVESSCTWEEIKDSIEGIAKRGYTIKYAVSDGGSNICKALKGEGIIRIEDCTHALGLLLKKRYKKNAEFTSFSKAAATFKSNVSMSKYAVYMPPKARSKARFLNLDLITKWAVKLLSVCEQLRGVESEKETYDKIKWIEDYEDLINDITVHQQLLNEVYEILKTKGLSEKTKQEVEGVVAKSKVDLSIKQSIYEYLKKNRSQLENTEKLICCSDIIESKFGHFKNRMSSNKDVGFTVGCLSIANNKTMKDINTIKKAMEQIKLDELSDWADNNLIDSLLKKKRKVFKSAA